MLVDLTKRELILLQDALDFFASACNDTQLRAIDRIGQKLVDAQNAQAERPTQPVVDNFENCGMLDT